MRLTLKCSSVLFKDDAFCHEEERGIERGSEEIERIR
jgi:hypothetical protein